MNYVLGRELVECSKEQKEKCLYLNDPNGSCKDKYRICRYPYSLNIFCTAKDVKCGRFDIIEFKGKSYIFFRCSKSCGNLIKNKKIIYSTLSSLKYTKSKVILGKELKKLLDDISKEKELKKSDELLITEFFYNYITKLKKDMADIHD